jgi:hypothetical protein
MKNRQEILQWALNLLNHHYMHQEDSKPREAITVDPQDMVKLRNKQIAEATYMVQGITILKRCTECP